MASQGLKNSILLFVLTKLVNVKFKEISTKAYESWQFKNKPGKYIDGKCLLIIIKQ